MLVNNVIQEALSHIDLSIFIIPKGQGVEVLRWIFSDDLLSGRIFSEERWRKGCFSVKLGRFLKVDLCRSYSTVGVKIFLFQSLSSGQRKSVCFLRSLNDFAGKVSSL